MFKTISVLLPTRGRVANLERLLRSTRETVTDWSEVGLLFRCDDDDMPTIEFLRGEGFEPLIGPRYRGYVSMPIFLKELMAKAKGDVIFPINDDGEFFTKDWPKLILEAANRYPDGIFNFGAETGLNSYIHPFPIMSRQYVEAIGHIGNEELYWIDVYQLDIARAFDRVIPLKSVVYKHYWFEETQANPDATRREAQKTEMEIVFDINKKPPDKPIEEFVYEDVFWNWREEYKAKHDAHVKLAVERVQAALASGKFGKTFESLGAALEPVLHTQGTSLKSILAIGNPNAELGGIADRAFDRVATIQDDESAATEFEEASARLTGRGDFSDFAFLHRVVRRVGAFNTLVIWGTHSLDQCQRAYFFFRRRMAFPGTVVLVSAEPGDGVERFVKMLAAGGYDQTQHELLDLRVSHGHIRAWAETLDGVPQRQPVNAPAAVAVPPAGHSSRFAKDIGAVAVKIGVEGYDIVRWLDVYFGVPQRCESFDMDVAIKSWKRGLGIYPVGGAVEEVERQIQRHPATEDRLVREHVGGYNIVQWLGRFFAVPQRSGELQPALAIGVWAHGQGPYMAGPTCLDVELQIARAAKPDCTLVKENVGGYNIICWIGRYFAVPQSVGAFRADVAIASWEGSQDGYLVGQTCAEVEAKIARRSAIPCALVKEDVLGHNVVEWLGRFYGVPQSVGEFKTAQAIESLEGRTAAYIVGESLVEVESKIGAGT